MPNVLRVALPDYNALTDTNLDHFSLYTDADNILIKEKTRGTVTFSTGTQTIAHNLGYVPDFKVFVNDLYNGIGWVQVAAQNSAVVVAPFWAEADETNLYITNNTGTDCPFIYFIFYDNQVGESITNITESAQVIKIAKSNADARSKDPNDFIFHSDLNTFKILKEANATLTYTADGEYTINHGLSLTNPVAFDLFVKVDSTFTVKTAGENLVRHGNFNIYNAIITTTQIKFTLERLSGTGTDIRAKYYIYESPLAGSSGISITPTDHLLRVSKPGYNALSELDPNNYIFLSGFNTLKYSTAGNESITIVGDGTDKITTITVPHNLGYYPYITVFVDDFINFPDDRYSAAPFRADTLTLVRRTGFYFDTTNLYLQFYNKSASTYTSHFYYKIYKNNLGF